jgi:hypothetical protein
MDTGTLLRWLVVAHVIASLGFVAMHGVSIYVLLRLRSERDPGAVRTLLNLSIGAIVPAYAFLGLILLTGIVSGIVGGYWTAGRYWLWASLALLVAAFLYMSFVATPYFARLRGAAGLPYNVRGKEVLAGPGDDAALQAVLAGPTPTMQILVVGSVVLVIIVWLMVMKPF